MDNKLLNSPAEYKRRREIYLDEQFHQRYPRGMFTLQRKTETKFLNGRLVQESEPSTLAIYWHPHRRHGCSIVTLETACDKSPYVGAKTIAVIWGKYKYQKEGIHHDTYQNNAFGKCTYYNSYEKMLKAARRFDFPSEMIEAFRERFEQETELNICNT